MVGGKVVSLALSLFSIEEVYDHVTPLALGPVHVYVCTSGVIDHEDLANLDSECRN